MKIQHLFRATLGSFAILAVPYSALAKQDALMVGKAVERATAKPSNTTDSTVIPVVLGADTTATGSDPTQPVAIYKLVAPETVRSALQRWAVQANWVFGAEFYALPSDVSVVVSADLGVDFKAAVRQLLDSTQGTAQPMQPCFYANQVLRVVARHELCARY